jgi:hypothetical protein
MTGLKPFVLRTSNLVLQKGQVPERPNGADCKSAVFRLQWFESTPAHSANVMSDNVIL